MSQAREKIAELLRADQGVIDKMEERLAETTGKKNVLDKIIEENNDLMANRLLSLGASSEGSAREIFESILSKVEADDYELFKALGSPSCKVVADCAKIGEIARKVINPPRGLFLKLDKAEEFLTNEPPRQIMAFLRYDSVSEMLAKEDLFEVYSALRFIEGSDWLNNVFFKQYENLQPEDFEEREIQVRALTEKWGEKAQGFIKKKQHNISHLKEMGLVFVLPISLEFAGEILRMFSLVMHYLYEIPFYASIWKDLAKDKKSFARNFISLLKGDVPERLPASGDKMPWLVVQRYLSKNDSNDWRLFVPHINPEAMHWLNVSEMMPNLGGTLVGPSNKLGFWRGLDWVGDYFKDEAGVKTLVSFNLVDTVMSLVKHREMVKYLYHHQEALWNKIFMEYFGKDQAVKFSRDYIFKGYFLI